MTERLDGLLAAALVCFAIIMFMLGAAFGHAVPWKAIQDATQTWATVGAVIVALWVGTRQLAAARSESHDRAVIAAARLAPRLRQATDILRHLITSHAVKSVENVAQSVGEYRISQMKVFEELHERLHRPLFEAPYDHLILLSGLGRNVAPRLAMGFAMLESACTELGQWNTSWGAHDVDVREAKLNEWMGQITAANELLDAGFRVCLQVAAQGAPRPTHQELYGTHSTNQEV